MSLHEDYKDEAAFRRDFIRPLLARMGFSLVTETHGTREYGKDFVFGELTGFGHTRYLSAQVKHLEVIRLPAVNELARQVELALTSPFTPPDNTGQAMASSVYIFNSGGITSEAREGLFNLLDVKLRANVFLLDGERLQDIDRYSGYRNDLEARRILTALRTELLTSREIWTRVGKFFFNPKTSDIEMRSASVNALDAFLSRPFLVEIVDYDNAWRLRQNASAIENLCRWLMWTPLATSALLEVHAKSSLSTCGQALSQAALLFDQIDRALALLRPLPDVRGVSFRAEFSALDDGG